MEKTFANISAQAAILSTTSFGAVAEKLGKYVYQIESEDYEDERVGGSSDDRDDEISENSEYSDDRFSEYSDDQDEMFSEYSEGHDEEATVVIRENSDFSTDDRTLVATDLPPKRATRGKTALKSPELAYSYIEVLEERLSEYSEGGNDEDIAEQSEEEVTRENSDFSADDQIRVATELPLERASRGESALKSHELAYSCMEVNMASSEASGLGGGDLDGRSRIEVMGDRNDEKAIPSPAYDTGSHMQRASIRAAPSIHGHFSSFSSLDIGRNQTSRSFYAEKDINMSVSNCSDLTDSDRYVPEYYKREPSIVSTVSQKVSNQRRNHKSLSGTCSGVLSSNTSETDQPAILRMASEQSKISKLAFNKRRPQRASSFEEDSKNGAGADDSDEEGIAIEMILLDSSTWASKDSTGAIPDAISEQSDTLAIAQSSKPVPLYFKMLSKYPVSKRWLYCILFILFSLLVILIAAPLAVSRQNRATRSATALITIPPSPTEMPSSSPSTIPSPIPSSLPSLNPSVDPSRGPSSVPTSTPSMMPSAVPSVIPSEVPTMVPSKTPSVVPSNTPSVLPSDYPSGEPSAIPTEKPGGAPSLNPIQQPSLVPSFSPSGLPSLRPSTTPSSEPSETPSSTPSLLASDFPSKSPSSPPSKEASSVPPVVPSQTPTESPSGLPTYRPSYGPSLRPSLMPSILPSHSPSSPPSNEASATPSHLPSWTPSVSRSTFPTPSPSSGPNPSPSLLPSVEPSNRPSPAPSYIPSQLPTTISSTAPSPTPTVSPSSFPSRLHSITPSHTPTEIPSSFPRRNPSLNPSASSLSQAPTEVSSVGSSQQPTHELSSSPSQTQSVRPSGQPIDEASTVPSTRPSMWPTRLPSDRPSQSPTTGPPSPTMPPTNPVGNLAESLSLNIPSSPSHPLNRALQWAVQQETESTLQRVGLATLYFATVGEQWEDQLGFLSEDNECTWSANDAALKGVVCHPDGTVAILLLCK
jgi:hypothetical protein